GRAWPQACGTNGRRRDDRCRLDWRPPTLPALSRARDGAAQETATAGNSCRSCSVSSKTRCTLCDKGLVCAPEIGGLHANCLRLGLRFDRLIERQRPFLAKHCFRHHVRKAGALRELLRKRDRFRLKLVSRNQPVEETPFLAFIRAHRAAGKQQLRG